MCCPQIEERKPFSSLFSHQAKIGNACDGMKKDSSMVDASDKYLIIFAFVLINSRALHQDSLLCARSRIAGQNDLSSLVVLVHADARE